MNAHVETEDGRSLSFFAAFFRRAESCEEADRAAGWAYSLTWAITDPSATSAYYPDSRVDASAPEVGLERIKSGRGSKDERLNRAMREVLERGVVPEPDRVFEQDAVRGETESWSSTSRLALREAGGRQLPPTPLQNDRSSVRMRRRLHAEEEAGPPRRRRRREGARRRGHVLLLHPALRSDGRGDRPRDDAQDQDRLRLVRPRVRRIRRAEARSERAEDRREGRREEDPRVAAHRRGVELGRPSARRRHGPERVLARPRSTRANHAGSARC